jgi:hypothetical protein
MCGTKLALICPGREANYKLHDKLALKRDLLLKDELPATVLEELVREVQELRARLQAALHCGHVYGT